MKLTPSMKNDFQSEADAVTDFWATLRISLKLWNYFVNWDKVYRNKKQVEIHLNVLNYLLGKEDFDAEFMSLLEQHPDLVKAFPTLVVRDGQGSNTYSILQDLAELGAPESMFDFSVPANSLEQRKAALEFVKGTGLIRLFQRGGVKNLVDYVLGVEAGIDSNARKNRIGTSMESIVAAYLEIFCKEHNLKWIDQATPSAIKSVHGFEVQVDKASRRFDFAVSDGIKLLLIETNFYGSSGSKLKATAGEYMELGSDLKAQGFDFLWVTDGKGWQSTQLKLEEAFEKLDYVWNLNWLSRGYLGDLFDNG